MAGGDELALSYPEPKLLTTVADEIRRRARGHDLIRRRMERYGRSGLVNLTGLSRGWPSKEDDLPQLRSEVDFIARQTIRLELGAVRFAGGDPSRHDAAFANRTSAGLLATMLALLPRGGRLLSIVPGGRSHASLRNAVQVAGGEFLEFVHPDVPPLAETGAALLCITPVTPTQEHMPFQEVARYAELAKNQGIPVFVDDAHMSLRMALFHEPPLLQMGPIDAGIISSDKHMSGPRGGILVGSREAIARIRSPLLQLGLEAQSGHALAIARAIEGYQPRAVKQAALAAEKLFVHLKQHFGAHRVRSVGPGVALSEEAVFSLAAERGRVPILSPKEASVLLCMVMLEEYGFVTLPAIGMPGSPAEPKFMMYPEGISVSPERFGEAIEAGLERLSAAGRDLDAASKIIFG